MDALIQNNVFNVQTKTTNVLIEQQVIISEQEVIDGFLDKINEVKRQLESLLPEYSRLIENTLAYIRKNERKDTYIAVYENMHPLIEVTTRLITALSNGKYKECYFYWIQQYDILKSDLNEILEDLRQKINGDIELSDLLNSIA